MKTKVDFYKLIEVISFFGCSFILVFREFEFDVINTILFFGVIFSIYRIFKIQNVKQI